VLVIRAHSGSLKIGNVGNFMMPAGLTANNDQSLKNTPVGMLSHICLEQGFDSPLLAMMQSIDYTIAIASSVYVLTFLAFTLLLPDC
jgi:hypothetical protein